MKETVGNNYQERNEAVLKMREGADAAWNTKEPLVSALWQTLPEIEKLIGKLEVFWYVLEPCAKEHFDLLSDEELEKLSDSGYRLCKDLSILSDTALSWHTLQGFINAEIMQRARE